MIKYPDYLEPDVAYIDIYNINKKEINDILAEMIYSGNDLYSESKAIIRNMDLRGYLLENLYGSGSGLCIDGEILYLKMLRYGLIEIFLYDYAKDLDTEEGKNFYLFMEKYAIKSEIFKSSETGMLEYNLKDIVDKEYEVFIQHIYNNMIPEYDEDVYYLYDRLTFRSLIPNMRETFLKLNHILYLNFDKSKLLNGNDVLTLLNNTEGNKINIHYNDYIEGKFMIIFYLIYLEKKGKLTIKKIECDGGEITFYFEDLLIKYHDFLLNDFEYKNPYMPMSYFDEGKLIIKDEEIELNEYRNGKKNIYYELIDLIYKGKEIYGNKITFIELDNIRINNNYDVINKGPLNYDLFHNGLKDIEKKIKNKGLGNKFFGVTGEGIELKC